MIAISGIILLSLSYQKSIISTPSQSQLNLVLRPLSEVVEYEQCVCTLSIYLFLFNCSIYLCVSIPLMTPRSTPLFLGVNLEYLSCRKFIKPMLSSSICSSLSILPSAINSLFSNSGILKTYR